MRLVTPERWYIAFWVLWPLLFVAVSVLLTRLFVINPLVQELRESRIEIATLKADVQRWLREAR